MDIKRIDGSTPYFLDVFTKHTKEAPESKMLYDDRDTSGLTRAQVDEASARVYAWLSRKGIGKEDFVLICMPRGVWSIVSMIGVWKAGAALTVVEDNYAEERIAFIKKDCGCKAVIDLDTWQEINAEEPMDGYAKADLHDAAFAVYTSGSSGTPKGVLHEYGNIKLNVLSAKSPSGPRTDRNSRVALIAPLNFVAATKTVLGLLYGNYSLYVIPYSISKNPLKLKRYYREARITNTFLSPSIIRATGGDISPYLKVVHTGSEPANGTFLDGVELVNNYSMSEGAFTLCQFVIDHPYDVCPVGKPNYDDLKIHLLDSEGNEAADGESGEICFENPFFRGYINMPDATKDALKGGLYHSGDLGKWDENGNLVLLGRANDMIKINGNRIEPAEIEAAFKAVTGKDWCAAKGFEKPEQSYIALYYQGELGQITEELREKMGTRLPYYMIPAHFIQVDTVPLLPNGKLDRKALPEPNSNTVREFVAPRNTLEKKLCKAFEKVLHIENVGITENFYELGGSSLSAMEVLVEMDLDDLSAADIFQGGTPENIAKIYEDRRENDEEEDIAAVEMRERGRAHYPTANQVNIIDYGLFSANAVMWNLAMLYQFGNHIDANRLCSAVNRVIETHPALSMVYEYDDDCELVQRIKPDVSLHAEVEDVTEEAFETIKVCLVRPFILMGQPLTHLAIYRTEQHTYLFFDVHHVMADGSAYQILLRDIARAYQGEKLELDTYNTYLMREEKLRGTEKYRKAKAYFEETYEKESWCINIRPDVETKPHGRVILPLERTVTRDEMALFEERTKISRNILFTLVGLLGLAKVENEKRVLLNWIFHDRTDNVKKNAFGCLFRNIPVGVAIEDDMTMQEFVSLVSKRSNESIANSCYEWSILNNHVYINDMLIVCYETASIMSSGGLGALGAKHLELPDNRMNKINSRSLALQVMDTPQAIMPLLMFNETIYSKEKVEHVRNTFTEILDRLLNMEDTAKFQVTEILNNEEKNG